jgi:hypothetical protein
MRRPSRRRCPKVAPTSIGETQTDRKMFTWKLSECCAQLLSAEPGSGSISEGY